MNYREKTDMPSELPCPHECHTDQPEKKDKKKNLFKRILFLSPPFLKARQFEKG
jgi:hypothetical protein